MKKILWIILCIFGIHTLAMAIEYPYPYYPLPEYSAASTFGSLSILINPAAMSANPDIEMMYIHSFNADKIGGDNTLLFSRNGTGLGYQNYRLSVDQSINAYTLAFSSEIGRGFYYGTSYRFMKSEDGNPYHNDHFWSIGLLYRKNQMISVGFVVNNLRRMEFNGNDTEIEYKLSMGYRPLRERLTISADWDWRESQSLWDGYFKGYAAYRITNALGLYGSVDEDGNFGLGLSFNFGVNQAGTYHSYSRKGKYRSGLIYSGYSYRPRGWLLPLKKKFLKLNLSGSYPETKAEKLFWQADKSTFLDLITALNRALYDKRIVGLYVEINHPRMGWAQLKELRDIFHAFRQRNKPVYCYLGTLSGNGSYYLASAADRIIMRRVDDLDLTGLMAEVTFVKGTLDKLGIVAEVEHAGKYKSASDLITRDSMSIWHREAIDQLLDDIYDDFTTDIADDRSLTHDSIIRLIDNGPFTSIEAVETGLVDKILYRDEVKKWLEESFPAASVRDFDYYRKRKPYSCRWGKLDQIAIIPVEGTLMSGRSGDNLLFGETIGSVELTKAIRFAREKKYIKAVVLRLNTPGGDGLASDMLHHELELLKKEKPLVISMGNVAASAGYFLASAGDYIYSQPQTVTGSIGVIYGKVNLSGLREKIGFKTYFLKRGENSDFFSTSTGFTDKQRKKMKYQLDLMYKDFVHTVADGRHLSIEYIDSIGQGRVWSGQMAQKLGLVDDSGGLWDAIQKARQLSGKTEDDIELVSFPGRKLRFLDLGTSLSLTFSYVRSLLLSSIGISSTKSSDYQTSYYEILPYFLKIY